MVVVVVVVLLAVLLLGLGAARAERMCVTSMQKEGLCAVGRRTTGLSPLLLSLLFVLLLVLLLVLRYRTMDCTRGWPPLVQWKAFALVSAAVQLPLSCGRLSLI